MKKPNKCIKCEKCFSQKLNLNEHILRVHDKKENFTCEECGSRFTEK